MELSDSDLQSRLRVVPGALAGYFRPATRDYTHTARLIAEGIGAGSGIVITSGDLDQSQDLRDAALRADLEVIIDPRSVELSFPGGFELAGVRQLPWAGEHAHEPEEFTGRVARVFSRRLAQHAVEAEATAVLSPSHYLESIPSPWVGVDFNLTTELRDALDGMGGKHIAIYYPLIIMLRTVGASSARAYVTKYLNHLRERGALDAVWLRIQGFGVDSSGPVNLRRYLEFARALHLLGVPLVGERTGTVGVPMLAFGAVGGIESGLTLGERCDLHPLRKKVKDGKGYMPAPRVYLQEIGAFVTKAQAQSFLGHRKAKNWFICQDDCCKGVEGMLSDPRRHFVARRTKEIHDLAKVPLDLRPDVYGDWLGKAAERVKIALKVDQSFHRHAKRITNWQRVLSEVRERDKEMGKRTIATAPTGRRLLHRTGSGSFPEEDQRRSQVYNIQDYLSL